MSHEHVPYDMVRFLWSKQNAIALCREIEAFAPECGCHVALTGGLLYKDGLRKDADIMLYRIRQVAAIDMELFRHRMAAIDIVMDEAATPYECTWVIKAKYHGKSIDFFFPDGPVQLITLEGVEPIDLEAFV